MIDHLYPLDMHLDRYYFRQLLHSLSSCVHFYLRRGRFRVRLGMCTSWSVSTFPGISPRTDNSHKRKALWNSGVQRLATAATHTVLALVVAATWGAWNVAALLPISFLAARCSRGAIFRQNRTLPRVIGFQNSTLAESSPGRDAITGLPSFSCFPELWISAS